jgi:flagellar basal-body rod protein FlgF
LTLSLVNVPAETDGGMNRGIYSTSAAMLSAQRQLDLLSNNLANVSTTGFKRDELAFGDAMEMALRADGGRGAALGTMSVGSAEALPYTAFELGQMQNTGNPFDFAIEDPHAMFAVQTPAGIRFTRNGAFQITSEGMLVTRDGHAVLDSNRQPIQIPTGELEAATDGTLNVGGQPIGTLGLFRGRFSKEGSTLYASADAQASPDAQIRWKTLETSNVNAVEAMTEMIVLQRRFDLSQRSILQQDELTQRLIQSLNQS